MSVFRSLIEEHRMLRALAGRLGRALENPDERFACREARNILLLLLRALESHEHFENRIFSEPLASGAEDRRRALSVLAREHREISRLRAETTSLLQLVPAASLAVLRPQALSLADAMGKHFDREERELWPRLNAVDSRSVRAHADHEAAVQVKEMKRELDGYWTAVTEYLASDS